MSFSCAVSVLSIVYFISILVIALLTNIHPFLHHHSTQDITITGTNSSYNYSNSTLDENLVIGWRLNLGISFAIGRHGGVYTQKANRTCFIDITKQTDFVFHPHNYNKSNSISFLVYELKQIKFI